MLQLNNITLLHIKDENNLTRKQSNILKIKDYYELEQAPQKGTTCRSSERKM